MSGSQIELNRYYIDQIHCPTCGMKCLQKNIYRHGTQIHQWSPEDCKNLIGLIRTEKKAREVAFPCAFCRALFKSTRHLLQHKKICIHNPHLEPQGEIEDVYEMIVEGESEEFQPEEVEEEEEEEEEEVAKPSTSSASNIVYDLMGLPHRQQQPQQPRPIQEHRLTEPRPPRILQTARFLKYPIPSNTAADPNHRIIREPSAFGRQRGTQLKCPECPLSAESLDDFINHCGEKHASPDRQFIVERRQFATVPEFKKWFDQRQEDTCTSLTKRTGHGGETLYRCHRVGKYRSVAKSRKSNPRKVDQTCTAYLKVVTDETGRTWATGCFTHIGHDLDHKLLWLTETQERYVRELIDLSWTSDQIFFYIRNEYKDYDCKLKYVSKNDIRNITVRYNRLKEAQGETNGDPNHRPKEQRGAPEEADDGGRPHENLVENLASIGNEDVLVPDDDDDDEEEEDLEGVKVKRRRRIQKEKEDVREEEIEEEVVTSSDMIVVEEAAVLNSAPEEEEEEDVKEAPGGVKEAPEGVKQEEEEEEEEYINVVDDDSMPELQKVN